MIIKEINSSDIDFLKAKEELLKYSKNDFYLETASNFILKDEDKIVGEVDYLKSFESCDILFIYIRYEYRNKGYAKFLLEETLKIIKERGTKKVLLEVSESNEIAIKLYKSLDFKNISRRKGYYDNKKDALIMIKEF